MNNSNMTKWNIIKQNEVNTLPEQDEYVWVLEDSKSEPIKARFTQQGRFETGSDYFDRTLYPYAWIESVFECDKPVLEEFEIKPKIYRIDNFEYTEEFHYATGTYVITSKIDTIERNLLIKKHPRNIPYYAFILEMNRKNENES